MDRPCFSHSKTHVGNSNPMSVGKVMTILTQLTFILDTQYVQNLKEILSKNFILKVNCGTKLLGIISRYHLFTQNILSLDKNLVTALLIIHNSHN